MTRSAAAVLFLLSGACALGYEVIWAKTLVLTLGGTAAAQAAVLAAFLAGLALGGVFLGAKADRVERPLRFFAWLELGVAACGYLAPWALSWPSGVLLVAAAAVLMGGTLPALTRAVHADGGLERTVARLYAVNNAGAALGALGAGFILIPRMGLTGASHALAGLGVAIAFAATWLDANSGPTPSAPPAPAGEAADPVPAGLILAAVFVSGLVSLCYEAAWVRLLAVVLGASTYSFTVMLAGFVGGMGLGAFLFRLAPRWPAARLYGLAQFGAGLAVLASWPVYERLPWLFWRMSTAIPKTPEAYPWFEAAKLGFCFLLTLLPTAFLGAAFPSASRTAAARLGKVGAGVGLAAALAALGNVLGAGTAGLLLLPALGVQGLLTLAAGANLLLGAAVLAADTGWPKKRRLAAGALAAAAMGIHMVWGGSWDRLLQAVGTHRYEGVAGLSFKEYVDTLRMRRAVLFQRDDAEASVSVMQMTDTGQLALMINGKADASTGMDMGTQIVLGALPFALKPDAKNVLLVGLGSGVTADTALRQPLHTLTVAEISPSVVEAQAYFKSVNEGSLADPRVRLMVTDGRAFLGHSPYLYDAVVSEPSNPWIAGVGNLFTQEYFRRVRAHLVLGGVMVQWFHLYETDDETVKSVLATFCSAFDDVSVWRIDGADAMLVGWNGAHKPDFAAMERAVSGRVGEALASRGVFGLTGILSLQTMGDQSAREQAAGGVLNRDRRPTLEYRAPRGRFLRSDAMAIRNVEDVLNGRYSVLLWNRHLNWRKKGFSDLEYEGILGYHKHKREAFRLNLLNAWAHERPKSEDPIVARARFELEQERPAEALAFLGKPRGMPAVLAAADAEEALYRKGDKAALPRAVALLQRLAASKGERPGAMTRLAELTYDTGAHDKAAKQIVEAAKLLKGTAAADLWLKASLWAMDEGKGGESVDLLGKALEADPRHEKARDLLEHLLKSYHHEGTGG